ncbi:MAG: aldehyde dehydrogenase family protein [Firmicutes bacterium]|nr:aldehyde dehydrogenase family protein [Bacillota bacterium]
MAETIKEMIEKARAAQEAIKDYTQEQVDKLVYEAGKIIYDHARELAVMAVEETGLGDIEEKVLKNEETGAVMWEYLKDKKSVGLLDTKPDEKGMIAVAHPVGVVCAVTPATNPTITPLGNFMQIMKGKNATIVTPAPRAQNTSFKSCEYIREALVACGAPADLIQCVNPTSIEKTQELMREADLIVATGSMGLTKAAYSSGTPAYGVGPGNCPVILDRGYDKPSMAAMSVESIAGDNGMLCDGNNLFLYPEEEEKEVFAALEEAGVSVYTDKETVQVFRDTIFGEDGELVSGLVGKHAWKIADAAGVSFKKDNLVIGLKVDEIGKNEILCTEILSPVVILKSYDTFENAVAMAIQNMEECGGVGHTAGLFTNDHNHVLYAGERLPVSRVIVNQPSPYAWGPAQNGFAPSVSEGCGTWGNNIISNNVDYIHFINTSHIAYPLDVDVPTPAQVFGYEDK